MDSPVLLGEEPGLAARPASSIDHVSRSGRGSTERSLETTVEVARRIEEAVRRARMGVPVIGDPTALRIDPEPARVALGRDPFEVREEPVLELWIGERRFHLAAGDSFRIRREPFRWRNPGKDKAVVVWVIAPPVY